MKLPSDISGERLAELLAVFGYRKTRQSGSHIRLTTTDFGEHHITIPSHSAVKLGTLNSIIRDVAAHSKATREEVMEKLFGKK